MHYEDEKNIRRLKSISNKIRKDIISMIYEAKSGHPGGSLSAADIVTALYFNEMRIDPKNSGWEDRDRFILSKGHACPLWYSCLAERGYFSVEELKTLRRINSRLQGHPDMNKLPGIDFTTGSLGQGLSAGIGMAIAAKLDKRCYRVYVVLGDGELDEGQVWEAVLCAARYKLNNLLAIIDRNGLQLDGCTEKILPLEPLKAKWKAFNWNIIEIDGHDFNQIYLPWKRPNRRRACRHA